MPNVYTRFPEEIAETERLRGYGETASLAAAVLASEIQKADSESQGDYLVVEDPEKKSTWRLPVKRGGKVDHRLMGAAWAALHGGFRGNRYEGPGKEAALGKLKRLYASEGVDVPKDKAEETEEQEVKKFNSCHKPSGSGGGQFCETGGGKGGSGSGSGSGGSGGSIEGDSSSSGGGVKWGSSPEHKRVGAALSKRGFAHTKSYADKDGNTVHEFEGKSDYYGRAHRLNIKQYKDSYFVHRTMGTEGVITPKMREVKNPNVRDYESLGAGHAQFGKLGSLLSKLLSY